METDINKITLKDALGFMKVMNELGRPLRFSGIGNGKVVIKSDAD